MMYRWSSQPGKAIYLCYQLLATIFFRLPIWVILALPRSNRPRQKWSVWRVIGLRLTQHMIYINSQTGPLRKLPNSLAITPGVGIEGVWIHPISDKLFVGELKTAAEANGVKPVKIPGYWIHKKGSSNAFGAPPAGGEKVLLVFHGGAYIRFSGHPEDLTSSIAYGFLEKVPLVRRVFSLEYRLSKSHENPFPAALLDAIAAYDYLVKVIGYPPSDIIVAGDSAGGNISLALSRYLVEHKDYDGVPGLPFAVVLLSPWADIGTSQLGKGAAKENEVSDWVTSGKSGKYSQMVFCGSMGVDAANTNRYISPASLDPRMQVDFIGHPRTFIACGGAEFLADIIRTLRDKMVKDMGHAVGYYEAPEAFHDYCCFPLFEPERSDTFQLISDWLSGDGS